METVVRKRLFTAALIEMLERGTRRSIGDGKVPGALNIDDNASWPFAVVHSVAGGGSWLGPSLRAPERGQLLVWQVTSSGKTREQAEALADLVRMTVLSRVHAGGFQVSFAGPAQWEVVDRLPYGEGMPGVDSEGSPPNEVFSVAEQFVFAVTPTT